MRYTISLLLASVTPALAEVPRIVTDLPPVASLTAQVMGDLDAPLLLLEQGANAHSFQLKPSQAAALAEADLVIWIGPEMTPWLDRALAGAEGTAQLGLLDTPMTTLRRFGATGDNAHDDDHSDTHADEQNDGHGDEHADEADHADEHDHDHSGLDPHAWLDPQNARLWLGVIAERLADLDPDNAATYRANATAATERLDALDAQLAARLAAVRGKPFVVFHDAYGYFVAHYGLTVAGTVALGDAASPGAAHLKTLRDSLASGVPLCIFPESNHDPKLVLSMVEGTEVRIGAALDPSGSMLAPGPDLYDLLLTGLTDALVDCLTEG